MWPSLIGAWQSTSEPRLSHTRTALTYNSYTARCDVFKPKHSFSGSVCTGREWPRRAVAAREGCAPLPAGSPETGADAMRMKGIGHVNEAMPTRPLPLRWGRRGPLLWNHVAQQDRAAGLDRGPGRPPPSLPPHGHCAATFCHPQLWDITPRSSVFHRNTVLDIQ